MELRPTEGGRNVIVKHSADGSFTDVTPPPFNARTRVHEYGGGDYIVGNGVVYFSNFADQRLYKQVGPGETPRPLTPIADVRYADACMDHTRGRLICVREDHTVQNAEAVNTIVALNQDSNDDCGVVLTQGNDFIRRQE
jgi:hypothetical protein